MKQRLQEEHLTRMREMERALKEEQAAARSADSVATQERIAREQVLVLADRIDLVHQTHERLEKATGPSRELDARIHIALHPVREPFFTPPASGPLCGCFAEENITAPPSSTRWLRW